MKNLLFLIAVLCIAAGTALPAQNVQPFQEIILKFLDDTPTGVIPKQIIPSEDGSFFVAGYGQPLGFIAKLNSCGSPLWSQPILYGAETELNGIVELPSGELVVAGRCKNCGMKGDTTWKALVVKTDAMAQAIVYNTFGNPSFDANANAVILTTQGKPAITGNVGVGDFLSPTDGFLAVLDNQLDASLWKEYNEHYYDNPQALTQLSDGGFALAGWSNENLTDPSEGLLIRTNAQGQLLWKSSSDLSYSLFKSVRQSEDGKIVALGSYFVNPQQKRDAYLAVHNSTTGALISDETYGSLLYDDAGLWLEPIQDGFLASGTWGEPSQPNWNSRSWVFRLNENYAMEENYFRDEYLFAQNMVNAVPLTTDGLDFAFLSKVHFFEDKRILFAKRSKQGHEVQLTNAPMHYQLSPRNLSTNKGTVEYEGSLNGNAYDELRLQVFRNDTLVQTQSDMSPQGNFSFQSEITAELANYEFRLSGLKNGVAYMEAGACDVVAGDAFLIQGQSNAVAGIPFYIGDPIDHAYNYHRNPFVRNFGLKSDPGSLYTWHKEADENGDYADNISGQWGLILGKKIVEEQGIPVAILNGAISGISIDSMMPDPQNHENQAKSYGRFLKLVKRSGLIDDLRGIIMFQGETNAAGGFWDSADEYFQKFVALDDAWFEDFPSLEKKYLFQIRPGAFFAGATLLTCLQIEEAQHRIPELLPDWQIMSSTGMNHDGTHYHYENGYERAGNDIYRLVAQNLYGETFAGNIHPPRVDSAWFSDCTNTQITLQMRHTDDEYFWTPGYEQDFLLEGSANSSVIAGFIQGNQVVLQLTEAPGPNFTGLSNTSHLLEGEAAVENANGIGMLAFYNFPVTACLPSGTNNPEVQMMTNAAKVFPNPCTEYFEVILPEKASGALDWNVYDGKGQLFQRISTSGREFRVEVSGWPAGIYQLKTVEGDQALSIRIAKL